MGSPLYITSEDGDDNSKQAAHLPFCARNDSTSSLVGLASAAPYRVATIAAAALANRAIGSSWAGPRPAISFGVLPASLASVAAMKLSPHPVVSTTFTEKPGTLTKRSLSR